MKKFNLEEAKAGKPVMMKNGTPVRILCFDFKHEKYPIVCAIENENCEALAIYTEEGRIDSSNSDEDLVMAPIINVRYANFYFNVKNGYEVGVFYDSEEKALSNIIKDEVSKYIKTIKVEWEG